MFEPLFEILASQDMAVGVCIAVSALMIGIMFMVRAPMMLIGAAVVIGTAIFGYELSTTLTDSPSIARLFQTIV